MYTLQSTDYINATYDEINNNFTELDTWKQSKILVTVWPTGSGADYESDTQAWLQNAINSLPTWPNNGWQIFVMEWDYTVSSPITIDSRSNVYIIGEGRENTRFIASTDINIFSITDTSAPVYDMVFENLWVQNTLSSNSKSLFSFTPTSSSSDMNDIRIEDVYMAIYSGYCITLDQTGMPGWRGSYNYFIKDCLAENLNTATGTVKPVFFTLKSGTSTICENIYFDQNISNDMECGLRITSTNTTGTSYIRNINTINNKWYSSNSYTTKYGIHWDYSTGAGSLVVTDIKHEDYIFVAGGTNAYGIRFDGKAGKTIDNGIVLSIINSGTGQSITNNAVSVPTNITYVISDIAGKQATLVSGTNIKTVNGATLLWSWNLAVWDALVANSLSQFASSTSNTIGVGNIELWHASDTTISRASAWRVSIEWVNVVTTSSTDTLTNKTIDLTNNTLNATSAQLATALSDETWSSGGGVVVFSKSPVIETPFSQWIDSTTSDIVHTMNGNNSGQGAMVQYTDAATYNLGIGSSGSGNFEVRANHFKWNNGDLLIEARTNGTVALWKQAALSTSATDGFAYIPTCAGTPTGTPTTITWLLPMVIDSTNNKMYIYSGGAWRILN